jgi:alkylation response protein AidB-like acyl-CoA dehydrogenase
MAMKTNYVDNTLRTEMPNFLASLETGRIRWDLLTPFPQEDPEDAARARELLTEAGEFVESQIDPTQVDLTGELPAKLIDGYRERRYNKLLAAKELGGHGLPPYSVYRIMQRLTSVSTPAAQVVGLTNTAGASMMLPALEDSPAEGRLRAWVAQRVEDGIICAFGDSDPDGQNNRYAPLRAVPVDDETYELTGRKLFTANGPIFDVIVVSATLEVDGQRSVVFPVVEATDPGFSVTSHVEFMGSKGLPSGALSFDRVRVPKWRVLHGVEEPAVLRRLSPLVLAGRVMSVSAPVTGIAKMCLKWSRDFINRRSIDGQPLGEYQAIQRRVATTAAEVYAMETVAQWCLLGPAPDDRWFEQLITKNISTEHAWRIVDRTVSLLGGRGFETARSKQRRGEEPVPLERYFRDARGFRIVANIDFQLDNQAGWMLLDRFYRGNADSLAEESGPGPDITQGTSLSPANAAHLQEAARQVREFTRACRELVTRYPDPKVLYTQEDTLITVGRLTSELFTICAVLARTSTLAAAGTDCQDLANIACTEGFDRLAGLWRTLRADTVPDFAGTSRKWLAGDDTLDSLFSF